MFQPRKRQAEGSEGWRVTEISVLGLALAIFAEPLAHWIAPHLDSQWATALSVLSYGLDHLGAVLVVAMLVRVAIEKASQDQFVVSVR
jgi:hypothetical protein